MVSSDEDNGVELPKLDSIDLEKIKSEHKENDIPLSYTFYSLFFSLWNFFKGRSYVRVHLGIFVFASILCAIIIWCIERDGMNIGFMDALFMSVSANCVTGLSTIDFSQMKIGSQILVLFLIIGGGQVLTMTPIIMVLRSKVKRTDPDTFKALTQLIKLVLIYNFGIQFLLFILFGTYMHLRDDLQDGVNPWWFSLFHTTSAFNNAGFSLYPDNLIRFKTDYVICIGTAFLITFGYTSFPIALRFSIWVCAKLPLVDPDPFLKLLKRKQALFGHFLPATETKFLILANISLMLVGTVTSMADWNADVVSGLQSHQKLLVFWFNDVCTRTAGFNSVDLNMAGVASNLITIVMMYISCYPVGLKVAHNKKPRQLLSHIGFVAKKIFFNNDFWLVIALFAICAAENDSMTKDPIGFSFFKILFETISAFGTVGLSLGYPGTVTSFSGVLTTFSKFVLICIMIAGRHRKLHRALLDSMDALKHVPVHSSDEEHDYVV